MSIGTKIKIRLFLLGVVLNASFLIMSPCQSIIVIVVNLNNLNMKGIYNLIHVDKFVGEKEVSIAHIHVLNVVIKGNVSLVNTKA